MMDDQVGFPFLRSELEEIDARHHKLSRETKANIQQAKETKVLVSFRKAEPQLIRVLQGEKIEPTSDDFYYFYFEDDDFANFRMNHPFSEGWQADDRP
jgi:hypothetical protein